MVWQAAWAAERRHWVVCILQACTSRLKPFVVRCYVQSASWPTREPSRRLEQGVNKRSDGGTLGEDDQAAQENQDNDDGQQPQFLAFRIKTQSSRISSFISVLRFKTAVSCAMQAALFSGAETNPLQNLVFGTWGCCRNGALATPPE